MAGEHLENLKTENLKLRTKHEEMSEDLTEQREMVRYLHGVIKNYEHLLREPGNAGRSVSAAKRSINRRRHIEKGSQEEDVFVRKVLESALQSGDKVTRKSESKQRNPSGASLTQSAEMKPCKSKEEATETMSLQICDEGSYTVDITVHNNGEDETISPPKCFRDQHSSSSGNETEQGQSKRELPTRDFSWSYKPRHEMIADMNCLLDSMLQAVEYHEMSLGKKEKHVSRTERRLEYLESIALGQESEWL